MENEKYTALISEAVDGFIAKVKQNSNDEIVFKQKFNDSITAKQVADREKNRLENE